MIIIKEIFTIHYWHHFSIDFIEDMCFDVNHSILNQPICSLFRFLFTFNIRGSEELSI